MNAKIYKKKIYTTFEKKTMNARLLLLLYMKKKWHYPWYMNKYNILKKMKSAPYVNEKETSSKIHQFILTFFFLIYFYLLILMIFFWI